MVKRLRLAILILGVVLAVPATATAAVVGAGNGANDARTAIAFDKAGGAVHESTAPVATTSRTHATKPHRTDRVFAVLAAAWAVLLVGLWLTRARLRVDASRARFVSVRLRGPPVLLHFS